MIKLLNSHVFSFLHLMKSLNHYMTPCKTLKLIRKLNKHEKRKFFQFIRSKERNKKEEKEKTKSRILKSLPLLVTLTWEPGWIMAVWMNQGRPRHTRMSKTLLPTALLTAMSPKPSLMTANEESASGTLTPAATNVRPITVSGMPKVLPEVVSYF